MDTGEAVQLAGAQRVVLAPHRGVGVSKRAKLSHRVRPGLPEGGSELGAVDFDGGLTLHRH